MKQYFIGLLASLLLVSSVSAQRNPNFLGCEFGVKKAAAVRYFEEKLSGKVVRENSRKDTLDIRVSGYVGDIKIREVRLFFHEGIFWGGQIEFRLNENPAFENHKALRDAIKQDFLKKYPTFKLSTEIEASTEEELMEGIFGSKETYKSKKWLAAFYGSFFMDMVWMQLHDIELYTKYIASRSNRVSF